MKELHGCGARRFTCPYHGWVYDTTGKLVGVPERGKFPFPGKGPLDVDQVLVQQGFTMYKPKEGIYVDRPGPYEEPVYDGSVPVVFNDNYTVLT